MTVLCKVCRVSSRAQRGDSVSRHCEPRRGAAVQDFVGCAGFWLAGLPRRLRLLAMTGWAVSAMLFAMTGWVSSRAQRGDPGGCRHCEPRRGAAVQDFVGCAGFWLAGLPRRLRLLAMTGWAVSAMLFAMTGWAASAMLLAMTRWAASLPRFARSKAIHRLSLLMS